MTALRRPHGANLGEITHRHRSLLRPDLESSLEDGLSRIFPSHNYEMLTISQNGLTPSRSINDARVAKLKKVMRKNIERV